MEHLVKIIVMSPRIRNRPIGQWYDLPMGLAYISSVLKNNGYDVTFINENERVISEGDNFIPWLNDKIKQTDFFCVGGLSSHLYEIKQSITYAKSIKPDIKIIVGGGIISSEPELMAEELGCDYAVVGEGENVILDIISGKINEKIIYAKAIDNLDDLPYPDYEGLQINNYLSRHLSGDAYYSYPEDKPRVFPLVSSRSCAYNCTFCFHTSGRKYRQRSIENISKEVEFIKTKYGANILAICDELIANDTDRLAQLCAMLKKFNIKWTAQMRVTQVTKEIMEMVRDSGCFNLSFGIEHTDDNVLKSMKKHITKEQIENALKIVYESNVGIQGNLIFGDPAESYEMVENTLNWWKKNLRYTINLSRVTAYPGTELYKRYVENKQIPDRLQFIKQECPFIKPNSYDFSKSEALISEFKSYNYLPVEVISKVKTRTDIYRGQLYNIRVKCCHCNQIVEYVDLYNGAGSHGGSDFNNGHGYRIGCKNCNHRIDFNL